ncbi:hypothetical protein [Halobacteriaceae bacterium SHR40]|uniref:hypothetical protein n=1 Tax=Halovenus amylolytica TaxID=2500550 RepID=UPI000FE2EBCB
MFSLLLAVSFLNSIPPASGYEISIYQVYPWYFWGLLIGATFLGQVVIVGSVRYSDGDDRTWVLGVILVLLSGTILLFMPIIRGYPVFGGVDELTHIGFVHDISAVGIADNIYPAMHLIVHLASVATGFAPSTVMKLMPIVMSFVFVGGMFYLAFNFYSRTHALYVLPFILFLFVGYKTQVPFVLSVLYVPFILYLFVKEQRTSATSVRIFLVIAIFGIVFFHPLTTAFLVLAMGIYVALEKTNLFSTEWSTPTMIPPLTVVVFSTWYLTFVGIIRRFERTANRITGSAAGESEFETVTSTVSTFSPDLTDLVTLAILDYGVVFILYALAGLFILVAGYLWLRNEIELNIFFVLFSLVFMLFTAVSMLSFVVDLGFGWGRVLFFENLFAAVLAGSLFYFLYQWLESRTVTTGVTVTLGVILFALTLVVVLGSFASVSATDDNPQKTEMDIDGAEWVLDNRDKEMLIDQYRISLWRYENFQNGTLTTSIRKEGAQPPEHFGYTANETIGQSYEEDSYLVLNQRGRITYPEVYADYPDYWAYTPQDFARLERDRTASKLYDNGEFDFYYIDAEERRPFVRSR